LGLRGVAQSLDSVTHVRFHGLVEQRRGRLRVVEPFKRRHDVLQQDLDPAQLPGAVEPRTDGGFHRATTLVSQNNEEWRMQMRGRVLQRTENARPEYV